MANTYFQFKEFRIDQDRCAMKVCTDACILGAWFAPKLGAVKKVLDIGSGTGLQMLMLAQKSNSEIQGVEIEEDAIVQLKENLNSSSWKNRLTALEGDVRTYPFQDKYDFVISNPPFFEGDLNSADATKNNAKHSSSLTLAELLDSIDAVLTPEGSFGILLPWHRNDTLMREAKARGFYLKERLLVKQTPTHDWFRVIAHFSRSGAGKKTEESFSIRDEFNDYSTDFTALLKDYYLHL